MFNKRINLMIFPQCFCRNVQLENLGSQYLSGSCFDMHHLPKDCCRYPSKCQGHCPTAAASTGGRYIVLQNLIRNSWGKGTKSQDTDQPSRLPRFQLDQHPGSAPVQFTTHRTHTSEHPEKILWAQQHKADKCHDRLWFWLKYFYVVSFTHLTSQNSLTENR